MLASVSVTYGPFQLVSYPSCWFTAGCKWKHVPSGWNLKHSHNACHTYRAAVAKMAARFALIAQTARVQASMFVPQRCMYQFHDHGAIIFLIQCWDIALSTTPGLLRRHNQFVEERREWREAMHKLRSQVVAENTTARAAATPSSQHQNQPTKRQIDPAELQEKQRRQVQRSVHMVATLCVLSYVPRTQAATG
jgi:hypothetical protein